MSSGKRGPLLFGPRDFDATRLDQAVICDLQDMFNSMPIIKVARKSFLSMVLSENFTFSIPALGLVSNKAMEKIIESYWMPWLRAVYDWTKLLGICPYYFRKRGEHNIPVVPDMDLGYVSVRVNETTRDIEYTWTWNYRSGGSSRSYASSLSEDKNILWIITEDRPTINGAIRSQLASLLPTYRSLLILRQAQNVAASQRARPLHMIEHKPNPRSGDESHLVRYAADFGAAAGIGMARREATRDQQIRQQTTQMLRQVHQQYQRNLAQASGTRGSVLWSSTPVEELDEMDAGMPNRVVVMREGFSYREGAKPELVTDYYKAEMQFNLLASASMDLALELLTPTGSARSQNIQGAERFENERIREQTSFFATVLKNAIVIAYRKQFSEAMGNYNSWRISQLHGVAANVAMLYPELDVVVDLSSSTVTSDDDLRSMRDDGLITQETMGKHMFKNKNMPVEQMVTLEWPDNVPRERIVKQLANNNGPSSAVKRKKPNGNKKKDKKRGKKGGDDDDDE